MANGKELKQEILSRGLRYNFVAKAVGIDAKQFNKYLNEHQVIPEVKLRAVCLTLKIPLKKFGLTDYFEIQNGQISQEQSQKEYTKTGHD